MAETLLPEIQDQETLKALAESVGGILSRWGLRQTEQRRLLGMRQWEGSRTDHLPRDPAVLERVGHLLAIDRALQKQDPRTLELMAWWIRTPQPMLAGQSPLAVMLAQGVAGIEKVRAIVEAGPRSSA